jgi:hypothetical protein
MAGSYASYDFLPQISYNIIDNLMDNPDAEIIWKLLKYSTNDDWQAPNLTKAQKRALMYTGGDDSSKSSVFFDSGMDDAMYTEKIYLRIYPYYCIPDTDYHGIVDVAFEMLCHYSINTLSNYTTRVDSIMAALIKCLNGTDIGGLGKMYFNSNRARMDKFQNFNQPPFKAKILLMSVNV